MGGLRETLAGHYGGKAYFGIGSSPRKNNKVTDAALPNLRPVATVDPPLRGEVGVARFYLMHVLAIVFPHRPSRSVR